MNKKLEKSFSFIRNFAEKYKNVIFHGFKKGTVKTINKKNRKKKKQNVTNIVDLKFKNPFINEEKKRKLDSFLMDQENELDLHENYTLFNKYNMNSDNLFFNLKNDNLYNNNNNNTSGTFLKSLNIENKNGDLSDDKIKINYLDSLNSLELKIKQEIKQNNDLLSKQKMMELNEYHYKTHNNGKKSEVRIKRTNSHLNKDSNRIYKRRKNNESQLDNVSIKSKNKKKKKGYPNKDKSYSNSSKNINSNSNVDSKQIKGTCLIQHNEKIIKKTNQPDNENMNLNTENILLKNNELIKENTKNNLVFGKNIYENINDMFHNVFEVNQEHNKNDIIKTPINNLMDREHSNTSRNTNINNINNNHIDDNRNTNESNIKEVKSNTNQKDWELFHKHINNNGTPFKEDNTFDIFFNEPLETPSIFQI